MKTVWGYDEIPGHQKRDSGKQMKAVNGHIQMPEIGGNTSDRINRYLEQNWVQQEGCDITGAELPLMSEAIWAKYKSSAERFRGPHDMSHVTATFQGDLKMQKTFSHKRAWSSAAATEAEITSNISALTGNWTLLVCLNGRRLA